MKFILASITYQMTHTVDACLYKYVDQTAVKRSASVPSEVNMWNPSHVGDEVRKLGIHSSFATEGRHH